MAIKRRKTGTGIIEALHTAQKIAYGPFIFQAALTAKRTGILAAVDKSPAGLTIAETARECGITEYGVQVLFDILINSEVVAADENKRYTLTKVGQCLLYDEMTAVNMDFTADVCYKGLAHTEESVRESRAAGLCELGEGWQTIYPHLYELPGKAKDSWFGFDHYYSDRYFETCAKWLADNLAPASLFDIGGNTGKFAAVCLEAMPDAGITVVDLPEQCSLAMANPDIAPHMERFSTASVNWLDESAMPATDKTADVIWMSQFLDCVSPEQAASILRRAVKLLNKDGRIAIAECLWDAQKFDAAKLSLVCSSMYFTVMANGNSRFFAHAELLDIIANAGLEVVETHHGLGVSHSLLICRPRSENN